MTYKLYPGVTHKFFRMGAIICSRKSTLNAWLAQQEAKARSAAA